MFGITFDRNNNSYGFNLNKNQQTFLNEFNQTSQPTNMFRRFDQTNITGDHDDDHNDGDTWKFKAQTNPQRRRLDRSQGTKSKTTHDDTVFTF